MSAFTILFALIAFLYLADQKSFAERLPRQPDVPPHSPNDRFKSRIESARDFINKNKENKENKKNAENPQPKNDFDIYIKQIDNSYNCKLVRKINEKITLLELTSQKWHGITWKHYMLVVVPDKINYADHSLIYIGGGSNGNEPKQGDILYTQALAAKAMMPVTIIFQVPNQPLDPSNKGNDFYEDALIGETLLKVMETGDSSWALLLPMTKSVIRAMDATQEFLKKEHKIDTTKFIVGGASKRGWTTWLTSATNDPRIVGIVPIVYNNLNLLKQFQGHVETWGTFSPRIHDYIDRGLFKMNEIPSPGKLRLMSMIDPYTYLPQITVPKLLIHGSNDPYWPTDATKYYWNEIKGQKYILTLPNAGHNVDAGLNAIKVLDTAAAFSRQVASGKKLLKLDWTLTEKNSQYIVNITTEIQNPKFTLWKATANSKNFQDAKWKPTTCTDKSIIIEKPKSEHIAFFIELESKNNDLNFSLTTQVWRF